MPHRPSVRAILAFAALLLSVLAAAAGLALPASANVPAADPPPSIAQLCAATGDQSIDALLDGVAETDLVGSLAPLLNLTVPQNQGRILKAGVDVDDVREALNCSNTPTSTTPPTSTTAPSVKTCADFDSRDAAQAAYDAAAAGSALRVSLDRDGDGKACEATEGASGSEADERCTNRIDYTGDPRDNATLNSIGVQTGTCPTPLTGGIDPTRDDGSVTGGGQVVDVPEGSASTGGGV